MPPFFPTGKFITLKIPSLSVVVSVGSRSVLMEHTLWRASDPFPFSSRADYSLCRWPAHPYHFEANSKAGNLLLGELVLSKQTENVSQEDPCRPIEGKTILPAPSDCKVRKGSTTVDQYSTFLGVVLDSGLTFLPHISYMCSKINSVNEKFLGLNKSLGNDGKNSMEVYYKTIFLPSILYCSSVWIHITSNRHSSRNLAACHRSILLILSRACRTVATSALEVLIGQMPLKYMAE